jgi:hypothetical protein
LTDYARRQGESTTLRLIPQSVTAHIQNPNLHTITEDRDNFDYIYLVNDLANLQGGKNHSKRNLISQYSRFHGTQSLEKELDLSDEKVQKDIEKVLQRWATSRGKESTETRDELTAVKRALEHHKILEMRAFGVYQGDELIAFTIFEILSNKVAVGHFEKADANYKGVFEHLNYSFAKHLASLDVEIINTEQDLGVEGLRKSKESYHPAEYIKKYTISRKGP